MHINPCPRRGTAMGKLSGSPGESKRGRKRLRGEGGVVSSVKHSVRNSILRTSCGLYNN